MTGDDDPDDRRTFRGPTRAASGQALFAHYQKLAKLRNVNPALVDGDFRILLANDDNGMVAYGRKLDNQVAVISSTKATRA